MSLFLRIRELKLKQLIWPSLWITLLFFFISSNLRSTSSPSTTSPTSSWRNSTTVAKISSLIDSSSSSVTKYFGSSNSTTTSPSLLTTPFDPSLVTADILTSNKVAVIFETRKSGNIIPLVLHFAAVLGPDWPIVIYTSAVNMGSFHTSEALLRYQAAGRVIVRSLDRGMFFPTDESLSWLLTQKSTWAELAPAEHVLVFQIDSILCSNAARSVEDFFEWDFIGAPVAGQKWYSGGLSLRKRSTMLRALERWEWEKYGVKERVENEWYYRRFLELQIIDGEEGIETQVKLPSMEVARTFAVETIDFPSPLGYHRPGQELKSNAHLKALKEWCPEYGLANMNLKPGDLM